MHFADNLIEKIQQTSPICVGIDPNFDLMPAEFWPKNNEKQEIEAKLWYFCQTVVDATLDLIPAIKPQIAYFEQFGTSGLNVLAKLLTYAKQKNLIVIMDAKRGDIGSTANAYSNAFLSPTRLPNNLSFNSDFESNALTVNPFLGPDTVQPFADACHQDKGIFVLIKTSNPGQSFGQNLIDTAENLTFSEKLAKLINEIGQKSIGKYDFSNIGAVIGATHKEDAEKWRKLMPNTLFLTPGIGSQGGDFDTIQALLNPQKLGVIIPISRAITYPSQENVQQLGYTQAIRQNLQKFISEFGKIL